MLLNLRLNQFSDIYHVSIDYILFNSDNGIFVYYEPDNHKYVLSKNDLNKYLNDGIIYYKNQKRFIDLNKKLELNNEISASALLNIANEVDKVNRLFDKANNCKMNIPLDKVETVSKLIALNDEKFDIIKNMIKVMTN